MASGRHRGPSTQVVPKSYSALALFTVVPCRGSGAATIHGHDPDESYKNMVSNLAGACSHGPSRVMWHPAIELFRVWADTLTALTLGVARCLGGYGRNATPRR